MTDQLAPQIRPALESDLSGMVELERVCFPNPWSIAMLTAELEHPSSLTLVAVDPLSEPTGMGYLTTRIMSDEAEILRIAVSPRLRRCGIGSQILRFALEHLARSGIGRCFLEVRPDNRGAIELYRRFGGRTEHIRKAYYRDRADALIMSLEPPAALVDRARIYP